MNGEQALAVFVLVLFTLVVVGDILWLYYGWVPMPPRQNLFVRAWLAGLALLVVMGLAALVSIPGIVSNVSIAVAMTIAALAGLLLLAGPLLTSWQERRPLVIAMNILSSLASPITILWGLLLYGLAHLFGETNDVGVLQGLALSVPLIIVTPLCMVISTMLARRGRRTAVYVAFIPVALAAFVNVAVIFVPDSAPGWTLRGGRWE